MAALVRATIAVPPQELVAMHGEPADHAAKGLLPAINIPNASASEVPRPKNEQARDFVLTQSDNPNRS